MENNDIIFAEDVEQMVNNPVRQAEAQEARIAKKRERLARLRNRALFCVASAAVVVALGLLELVVAWFAVALGFAMCVIAVFFMGRWYESWRHCVSKRVRR